MSKKDYTHVVIILDRSGSMGSIRNDMEGGFNEFISQQKEEDGEATLTLAQFDSDYEVVHNNIGIADVPELNLEPRGFTALLDAIGKTLNSERDRINKMNEDNQPEKVAVVTITDGYENSSHEYTKAKIAGMIKNLEAVEDPDWSFVFLGANMDAIAEGGSMGVRAVSSYTYDASGEGTKCAFMSLSKGMSSHRKSSVGTKYAFEEEDRKEQADILSKKAENKFGKAIPSYVTDLASEDTEDD